MKTPDRNNTKCKRLETISHGFVDTITNEAVRGTTCIALLNEHHVFPCVVFQHVTSNSISVIYVWNFKSRP